MPKWCIVWPQCRAPNARLLPLHGVTGRQQCWALTYFTSIIYRVLWYQVVLIFWSMQLLMCVLLSKAGDCVSRCSCSHPYGLILCAAALSNQTPNRYHQHVPCDRHGGCDTESAMKEIIGQQEKRNQWEFRVELVKLQPFKKLMMHSCYFTETDKKHLVATLRLDYAINSAILCFIVLD